MNMRIFICLFFFVSSFSLAAQVKYSTRTAHINVKSVNKFKAVEADNFQVASTLDPQTGNVNFFGLLKSFEFKLGALDQVYNSKMVANLAKPKFRYTGKIKNLAAINFDRPGKYNIRVEGNLYLWDMKRITPGTGTVTVLPDGSLEVFSDISFMIEEASVKKANDLMKRYLPSGVNISTDQLGIGRKVRVQLKSTYKKRGSRATAGSGK
jgi:hypothetical protein